MQILPETIFEDAAPLSNIEDTFNEVQNFVSFTALKGRNVYVEMNDGKYFVGHLSADGTEFTVGTSDALEYKDVKYYREV